MGQGIDYEGAKSSLKPILLYSITVGALWEIVSTPGCPFNFSEFYLSTEDAISPLRTR